jgi:hypothetical protein
VRRRSHICVICFSLYSLHSLHSLGPLHSLHSLHSLVSTTARTSASSQSHSRAQLICFSSLHCVVFRIRLRICSASSLSSRGAAHGSIITLGGCAASHTLYFLTLLFFFQVRVAVCCVSRKNSNAQSFPTRLYGRVTLSSSLLWRDAYGQPRSGHCDGGQVARDESPCTCGGADQSTPQGCGQVRCGLFFPSVFSSLWIVFILQFSSFFRKNCFFLIYFFFLCVNL